MNTTKTTSELPKLMGDNIFTRGGFSGRKIHAAYPGSSVLNCGHWLKTSASRYQLTETQVQSHVNQYGMGVFCRSCFKGAAFDADAEATQKVEPHDPTETNLLLDKELQGLKSAFRSLEALQVAIDKWVDSKDKYEDASDEVGRLFGTWFGKLGDEYVEAHDAYTKAKISAGVHKSNTKKRRDAMLDLEAELPLRARRLVESSFTAPRGCDAGDEFLEYLESLPTIVNRLLQQLPEMIDDREREVRRESAPAAS